MTLERLESRNSEKNERTRNGVNSQTLTLGKIVLDEAAFSSARNLTKVSVLMCSTDIEDSGNRSVHDHSIVNKTL